MSRSLQLGALDVALGHAAERARGLVENLGTPPVVAARFAARRVGLDPREVLLRMAGVRISESWRSNDRRRATSRPMDRNTKAALEADGETET